MSVSADRKFGGHRYEDPTLKPTQMLEAAAKVADENEWELMGWMCQWGEGGGSGWAKLPQFGLYGHGFWRRNEVEQEPHCPDCRPVFLPKNWKSPFEVFESYRLTTQPPSSDSGMEE